MGMKHEHGSRFDLIAQLASRLPYVVGSIGGWESWGRLISEMSRNVESRSREIAKALILHL
jgi:hypothetical protein